MQHRRHLRSHSTKKLHRGSSVVEFAVVSPLLIMLTFGMMEVGRGFMVKQLVINASREGARMAVLPASDANTVITKVQQDLAASSVSGAQVTISPAALSAAPAGTAVTVSITVPAANVSWIPTPMFMLGKDVQAQTTMRRESL